MEDFIKMCTNISWPFAILIIVIIALFLFRKQINQFISGANDIGVGSFKMSRKIQEQPQDVSPSRVKEILRSYQSPLLTEQEEALKKDLESLQPKSAQEREELLIKALASNQITLAFEKTYFLIYGSQLAVLQFLTSSLNILEDIEKLKPFYERAKSNNPSFYSDYSFESWVSFMKASVLIVQQDTKVVITVRGKEFLKYLIEQGYSTKKAG